MPIIDQPDSEQRLAASTSNWTLANALTVFRIVLTVPFLFFINEGKFGMALAIFFLASLTDYADGFVARAFKQQSLLGQKLDPLADKLLTTAGFIVMALPHERFPSIPIWLAVAVVARDAIILIGSFVVYLLTKIKEFKPTLLGKINTFLELGLIVVFLATHTFGVLIFLLPLCYLIVLASVIVSGASYIGLGIRMINLHRRLIG